MSIFSEISATMQEQAERDEQAKQEARASITNIVGLDDIWKFRHGYEQEVLMGEIQDAATARIKARVEERIQRAHRFVRAYDHVMTVIIEPSTGKPMFNESIDVDGYLTDILTEAARFDFFGMNFDNEFDLMEFVLTHEKPIYVYEFVDNFVNNFLAPIMAEDTAHGRQQAFRVQVDSLQAEYMRLGIDAFMMKSATLKNEVLNMTRYGHAVEFNTIKPVASAPAEPAEAEGTAAAPVPEAPAADAAPTSSIIIVGDDNIKQQ